MAQKTVVSERWSINWRDFFNGLKTALWAQLAPLVYGIINQINTGDFNINWKVFGAVALAAFLGHVVKQFFEPTKVIEINPSLNELNNAKAKTNG